MSAFGIRFRKIPGVRPAALVAAALGVVAVLVAVLVAGRGSGTSGTPDKAAGPVPAPTVAASGGSVGAPLDGPAIGAEGGAGAGVSGAGSATGSGGSSAAGPGPAPTPPLVPAKVIKNGQIGLQVRSGRVASTVGALTVLASAEGGFVASTTSSQAGSTPSGSVVLRVPSAVFEATVAKVRSLGTVVSATTTGQDVTAQYVDLQARITALQQAQGRFLTILAKASSIGDILAVQQQVDSVNTQLEQLEGQQRVTDDQTSYGTLTVDVDQRTTPPPPPKPAPGPWKAAVLRAGDGFADGVQGLVSVSGGLGFALVLLALLGTLVWLGWRRLPGRTTDSRR
jgi:hypothetical protein